jgi:hypothetical protein
MARKVEPLEAEASTPVGEGMLGRKGDRAREVERVNPITGVVALPDLALLASQRPDQSRPTLDPLIPRQLIDQKARIFVEGCRREVEGSRESERRRSNAGGLRLRVEVWRAKMVECGLIKEKDDGCFCKMNSLTLFPDWRE